MPSDESSSGHTHSVTRIINRLRSEDPDAAGEIWQRYFERLLPLARSKLKALSHRVVDEDDILVSVFDRFFQAAKEGRFARLQNRDDLWQILLLLTDRKVADQYRQASTQKRGGDDGDARDEIPVELTELTAQEPGPEFVATFNDNLARAMSRLDQETVREVALLRMEGYENREIAGRLGISLSSVERKLRVVREKWAKEFAE